MKPSASYALDQESGQYVLTLTLPLDVEPTDRQKQYAGYLFNRAAYLLGSRPPVPKRERDALTKTEKIIVGMILKGMSNPDIADELCVNISSVKFHVSNLFRKHNVKKRADLIFKLSVKRQEPIVIFEAGVLPVGLK